MPRSKDNSRQLKNRTQERLRATPFEDVSVLEAEENQIRHTSWQRLTTAKAQAEILTKPDFKIIKKELDAGLSCTFNDFADERDLYRIYPKNPGIQLDVNEGYVQRLGDQQVPFLKGTLEAGIEGWGKLFYQLKGLIPQSIEGQDALAGAKPSKTE